MFTSVSLLFFSYLFRKKIRHILRKIETSLKCIDTICMGPIIYMTCSITRGGSRIWKKKGRRWLGASFWAYLGQFRGLFKEFGAKTGGRVPPAPPFWIRAWSLLKNSNLYEFITLRFISDTPIYHENTFVIHIYVSQRNRPTSNASFVGISNVKFLDVRSIFPRPVFSIKSTIFVAPALCIIWRTSTARTIQCGNDTLKKCAGYSCIILLCYLTKKSSWLHSISILNIAHFHGETSLEGQLCVSIRAY